MLESTLFYRELREGDLYAAGYSLVKKTGCEVYNYISPTLRILRFTQGEAELLIDGIICPCRQGDVAVLSNLNKRNIHSIQTGTVTYEVFEFYPSAISRQLWRVFYQDVHKVTVENTVHVLLDMLRREITEKKDGLQLFAVQRLLELLALELKRHMGQGQEQRIDSALFQISSSIQYMAEHFHEALTVEHLAEDCGYSVGYYTRLFKKYMGVSPRHYLTELRLENAAYLINRKKLTVAEAARQSGFASSSAFYKAFHAYKNTTPGKYTGEEIL